MGLFHGRHLLQPVRNAQFPVFVHAHGMIRKHLYLLNIAVLFQKFSQLPGFFFCIRPSRNCHMPDNHGNFRLIQGFCKGEHRRLALSGKHFVFPGTAVFDVQKHQIQRGKKPFFFRLFKQFRKKCQLHQRFPAGGGNSPISVKFFSFPVLGKQLLCSIKGTP